MAQAKKFGTFGGVFTPSILTILGVIMYLRLGWVVGEAGLYYTLGLILIAHVISISTGLSLSSIATDKKIKTGGIYYMLSRSLGLPMGGSIGITLFLGTALSISLYIVGFVENFLSISVIQEFLGMTGDVNDIRIIGTGVIIILVILAYISTSIAIKTQYFILGAIALSLLSIVVGIFINPEIQSAAPALLPSKGSPNLIVIFAVFFPAVTGFTAGVAMSGDLKTPKESIPKGTLMSISVGFVIYVGLAVLIAFFVDRDLLLNDTNFLQKIAWFSPLVIAGIWGATLSSALGGILGAPRILQAMSGDKVTHKFFAKGVGASNEPRRALILTFLLSEIGILIGQLDVIAGIVSMFYIAAYGFINLAYVLERWANSDFRPSMKISIWVGIIGFVASLFVMINLDTLGMIVAFGIMFGIYLLLKRREFQGNMTNVWQSVWTSLIRTSLDKINEKPLNENNWQPNIILFSGGGNARPHLMEFGHSIAGTKGFLSNFDLHIKKEDDYNFTKTTQKVASGLSDKYPGVFTRRQSVSNIYEGIEIIAQTYGFSGVEPNTVMMGWARQSSNPQRFSQMVLNLSKLDMNVVMVDYDKTKGWGKKQSIDIWWRGGGNNVQLALNLAKFITASDDWNNAKIRLIIVNQLNDASATIYENAVTILESLRIEAEIQIINNEIEQRNLYEIIKIESINTDLIFLGFPPIEKGEEKDFVEKTNALCHDIGTVAIIQASKQFKDLSLGDLSVQVKPKGDAVIQSFEKAENIHQSLNIIQDSKLNSLLRPLASDLDELSKTIATQLITPIFEQQIEILNQLQKSGIKNFDTLISRSTNKQLSTFKKTIGIQHQIFMRSQLQFLETNIIGNVEKMLQENMDLVLKEAKLFENKIPKFPYRVKSKLHKDRLAHIAESNSMINWNTLKLKPLFLFSSEITYFIHLRELLLTHYPQSVYQVMYRLIVMINKNSYQFENDVFKAMRNISGIFDNTIDLCKEEIPKEEEIKKQQSQVSEIIQKLIDSRTNGLHKTVRDFKQLLMDDLDHFILQLNYPLPNVFIDHNTDFITLVKKKRKQFIGSVSTSILNKELVDHVNQLNLLLLGFRFETNEILKDFNVKITSVITQNFSTDLTRIIKLLADANTKTKEEQKLFVIEHLKSQKVNAELKIQQEFIDQYNYSLKKIKNAVQRFPEQLTIYTDSIMFTKEVSELKPLQSIDIALRRTVDFMIERAMIDVNELIIKQGQEINILKSQFNEIVQLVTLNATDNKNVKSEYTENIDSKLQYHEIIHLSIDKSNAILDKLNNKQELINGLLLKKMEGLKASSELYPFIRSIQDLKQYIREEKNKNWLNVILGAQKGINNFISDQLNKLWYNQSSGQLIAQKLSKNVLQPETRIETLLEFKEKVSPNNIILNKIPDYYKQLFLRKQFYLNEFWVGREEELSLFADSMNRWKLGYAGGIMVLGERNSGKSFFANYVAQHYDIKGDTYFINPPFAGSVSVSDLLNNFQQVTENQGTFAQIFHDIPNQSVFFIDDLELWWEKSAEGMAVVKQLMILINRFSHQHLFVIMSNIHSFRLINKYKKIDTNFLSIIELRPFNARQLKHIVMKRHQTSTLQFKINNITEARYRSWNYARLFSRYFRYSEGNPGVALQTWIKSINDVNNNNIFLNKPKAPDASLLVFLETEWMIFLMHFLLHKRMTRAKLLRVSLDNRAQVIKRIRILRRAGLIITIGDDILDIDPYILPFLRKAFIKQELL